MKVTSKGQVTIPIEVRDMLEILPNSEVEFVVEGGQAVLRKKAASDVRGRRLVASMRGKSTVKMTTDQIMSLTRAEPQQ